jgi:hypothetical protein
MQVIEQKIEIDKALLVEIELAAEFEHKSLEDYVNFALQIALKRTKNKRLMPEQNDEFFIEDEQMEKFWEQV